MELYSLPAKQFLEVINDVVSDNDSETRNGIKKLNDLLKIAKRKKEEYEQSNPESKENNDDDFNSFLKKKLFIKICFILNFLFFANIYY